MAISLKDLKEVLGMTTKITVEAVQYPVQVTTSDDVAGSATDDTVDTVEIVPAGMTKDFYLTSTRALSFEELAPDAN